jgi:hypothetical protein
MNKIIAGLLVTGLTALVSAGVYSKIQERKRGEEIRAAEDALNTEVYTVEIGLKDIAFVSDAAKIIILRNRKNAEDCKAAREARKQEHDLHIARMAADPEYATRFNERAAVEEMKAEIINAMKAEVNNAVRDATREIKSSMDSKLRHLRSDIEWDANWNRY